MFVFGNHIHVASVEEHLTTRDNGVVATFEQAYVLGPNDQRLVITKYVRWVEEILELNYGVLNIVVLLCNQVKVNYNGSSAIVKQDEYEFTLVNFDSLIPILD